ncbi:MAG: ABC transporter permease [Sphingobacteriia bacterium]|nr:ABC transporter permease [Sphingobacteriia bacterium]
MNNFINILKKEIKMSLVQSRFIIILIFVSVVIATGFFSMYRDYIKRMENYEILTPGKEDAIALIKPASSSILVKGVDESICRPFSITFLGIDAGSGQQSINWLFSLFQTPDLLFIISTVLSLCALFFSYDLVSREREEGTFKYIMANSVSRTTVITAKLLGAFICFIVPVVITMAIGIAIIAQMPQVLFTETDYWGIFLLFSSTIIYLFIFFSIGLLMSVLMKRSVSSLILSLFIWTVLVFVIPQLTQSISKNLAGAPSVAQSELKQNLSWASIVFERINGINGSQRDIQDEWEQLSMEFTRGQEERCSRLSKSMFASPTGIFTLLAPNLMRVGLSQEKSAKNAVWQYYKSVKSAPTNSDGMLVGNLPRFSFDRNQQVTIDSQSASMALIGLLLYLIVPLTLSFYFFSKYDFR